MISCHFLHFIFDFLSFLSFSQFNIALKYFLCYNNHILKSHCCEMRFVVMYDFQMNQYGQRELPPDYDWKFKTTPVHIFHYIINGSCTYYYNDKAVTAQPGYLYIIPQQLKCDATFDRQSHFNHLFFGIFYSKIYSPNDIITIKVEDYPVLQSIILLLSEYISAFRTNSFSYPEHKLHTNELFNFFLYVLESHQLLPYINDARITDSLNFIHSHFHENISIEDISASVNLCAGHFNTIFKDIMQVSPYQYLKQFRLTSAIRLIREGVSVSAAAVACGYQSVYSLSSAIKKYTKLPPTWYKSN